MQTPGTTVLPSPLMMHACAERQQAWRWLCSNMLCAECRVLVFSLEPPSEAVATCSILPEEMNLADVGLFILIMRGLEYLQPSRFIGFMLSEVQASRFPDAAFFLGESLS